MAGVILNKANRGSRELKRPLILSVLSDAVIALHLLWKNVFFYIFGVVTCDLDSIMKDSASKLFVTNRYKNN